MTNLKKAISFIFVITVVRIFALALSPLNLSFDEAQYWHWSQNLAFGYFSKPPFVAWAIALTTSFFNDAEFFVRLSSPFAHAISAIFIFFAAKELFDEKVGFWSAIAYVSLPAVSFSSMFISTDPFLLMFFSASIWFSAKIINEPNKFLWWAFLGVTIGFGMLSKYAMIIFPIAFLIFAATRNPKIISIKKLLCMAIPAITIYLPNYFWNASNHFASYAHTGSNANLKEGVSINFLKALEFFGAQFGIFNPIFFVILIYLAIKPKKQKNTFLLYLLSVPLIVIMTIQGLISRANANWAAASYVAATIFVVDFLIKQNREKLLKIAITLNLALMLFVYIGGAKIVPNRLLGWDIAGKEISQIIKDFPEHELLFVERKILTPMLYYVKPHSFNRFFKWNLKREIHDHYDLTTNLDNQINKNFIYVSRWEDAKQMSSFFKNYSLIKTIEVNHIKKTATKLYVYNFEGFKGYEN